MGAAKRPIWASLLPLFTGTAGFAVASYTTFVSTNGAIAAFIVMVVAVLIAETALPEDKKVWNTAVAMQAGVWIWHLYIVFTYGHFELLPGVVLGGYVVSLIYLQPGKFAVLLFCAVQVFNTIGLAFRQIDAPDMQFFILFTLCKGITIFLAIIACRKYCQRQADHRHTGVAEVLE